MTRYCIKQDDTGLYWCSGSWGEEPEWFDYREACAIARRVGHADPSPLTVEPHEFSTTECDE